jgi:hypothetical protein
VGQSTARPLRETPALEELFGPKTLNV